jgi:AcrR family transcriptional regulator
MIRRPVASKGRERVNSVTVATKSDRRTAICEAVFELLGEVGYDRMSMDAVAARARASKATIYRAWPNKPDLVMAAIMHRFGEATPPPDTGSLRGDLRAHLSQACGVACGEDGAVASGLLTAAAHNPDLSRIMHLYLYDMKKQAYDVLIARAIARGELVDGTDAGLIYEITHALVLARRLWDLGPLDDAFAESVVDRVLLPVLRQAAPADEGRQGAMP